MTSGVVAREDDVDQDDLPEAAPESRRQLRHPEYHSHPPVGRPSPRGVGLHCCPPEAVNPQRFAEGRSQTGRRRGTDRMASSAGYNKMFPVSWTELHRDARALAWRLADLGPFKGLVAITRGGLVPAAIVARELNLRLIDTVCCSTYDRMERGAKVELLKGTPGRAGQGQGLADRRRPGRHRRHRPGRARHAARGAFRHGLCQAGRPADSRQLHHRGEPGHLDPVPLGPGGGHGQDHRRDEGRHSDEVLRHPRAQGHRLAARWSSGPIRRPVRARCWCGCGQRRSTTAT